MVNTHQSQTNEVFMHSHHIEHGIYIKFQYFLILLGFNSKQTVLIQFRLWVNLLS